MKRAERSFLRQREHHQDRIAKARTPRQRLAAVLEWLAAEAKRATDADVEAALAVVQQLMADMRAANHERRDRRDDGA